MVTDNDSKLTICFVILQTITKSDVNNYASNNYVMYIL